MCCNDRLSFWGMLRHSHAHGQCELSCTAGVMLNVRRSDSNANQVSKLTLHSHRCTSDLQWFISQSESMCHCVECSWVNTALAKVHHLAAPPSAPIEHEQHSPEVRWSRSQRVTFRSGKPHAIYLSKSLKSVLKGYYKSKKVERWCVPTTNGFFCWVSPAALPFPDSHSLPVPRSERGPRAATDPNYQTVIHNPSFTSSIAAHCCINFSQEIPARALGNQGWRG